MTRAELFENIKSKKSFLCIGLDPDLKKIPRHLHAAADPVFEFNKQIIDATHHLCVSYKPNTAFYESLGSAGWEALEKTVHYLREPENTFIIADAKRGDIGNTSDMYAQAFFGSMDVDALTLAPYMGEDSIKPYLNYEGKWVVILALTSNSSASDFQFLTTDGRKLFEEVLHKSKSWGNADNTMYVIGATKTGMLTGIRKIIPDHFLLVPGVGAQGGSLEEVAKYGMNKQCGLLVNSSRGIIYAGSGKDFAKQAALQASLIQQQMEKLMDEFLK